MEMRICNKCGGKKPIGEFINDQGRKLKTCKECNISISQKTKNGFIKFDNPGN